MDNIFIHVSRQSVHTQHLSEPVTMKVLVHLQRIQLPDQLLTA